LDQDYIPDSLDDDIDGDGVLNIEDAFPRDPTESTDLDQDGIGDNSDSDIDGDLFSNDEEADANTDPYDASDYPDRVAPSLTVNNGSPVTIEAFTLLVTGSVSDAVQPHSGVRLIRVSNNRYPDLAFAGLIDGEQYRVEVPLAIEVNNLTISAVDLTGNTAVQHLTVDRISPPRFNQVTPVQGSIVNTDRVDIAGQVLTYLPLSEVSFYVNEWYITPIGSAVPGVYSFNLADIPLTLGQNSFDLRVVTPDGATATRLEIEYLPDGAADLPAPEVQLLAPTDGQTLQEANFELVYNINSAGGPVSLELNGQTVAQKFAHRSEFIFSAPLSFGENADSTEVVLQVTDTLGKSTEHRARFYRDGTKPVLILAQALNSQPALNLVNTSQFYISGSVTDEHLAGLLINGQAVALTASHSATVYNFAATLQLAPAETSQLLFEAWDTAGNLLSTEYSLQYDTQYQIHILVPGYQAALLSDGAAIPVQVAVRIDELTGTETVQARYNDGQPVPLTLTNTFATGSLLVPPVSGQHTIRVEILNAAGQRVAADQVSLTVQEASDIELELLALEPLNNAKFAEPNQPIELYFNKAIDLAQLQVTVQETLHGNTYINQDAPGVSFTQAQGYVLQEVHRDLETVPGSLSLLPDQTSVAFYPERWYGFDATLYLTVSYQGNTLHRGSFQVRPLPTFIHGGVADQFGQPLAGIEVSIPALQRSVITNNDGAFGFGYQEAGDQLIPGGQHQLVINADFKIPYYGTHTQQVTLQAGRKANLGMIKLQELSRDVAFAYVASGQETVLADGALQLDLREAELYFPGGASAGSVHIQFMDFSQLSVALRADALPLWLYSAQPKGTILEGQTRIRIKIPQRNGTLDYLHPGLDYVLLLGLDPVNQVMVPVGVGRVDNGWVTSVGALGYQTLDYLGYAMVDPSLQTSLGKVALGERSLLEFMSELSQ